MTLTQREIVTLDQNQTPQILFTAPDDWYNYKVWEKAKTISKEQGVNTYVRSKELPNLLFISFGGRTE